MANRKSVITLSGELFQGQAALIKKMPVENSHYCQQKSSLVPHRHAVTNPKWISASLKAVNSKPITFTPNPMSPSPMKVISGGSNAVDSPVSRGGFLYGIAQRPRMQ
ncbi:hypothetical protein CEXT_317951 [Caerostris extrusa]|uniref:Uncharacterized protein n=1 Tax=Caerostris extrusa TaxID=172846 RepID=A0AAV4Q3C2_CAEEX|nr:hypothetical protein CEXT_317951 [Caerostris extrusa]